MVYLLNIQRVELTLVSARVVTDQTRPTQTMVLYVRYFAKVGSSWTTRLVSILLISCFWGVWLRTGQLANRVQSIAQVD